MKSRWVYLVKCNREPIVYGVTSSYRKALNHAKSLLEFRRAVNFFHYVDPSMSEAREKMKQAVSLQQQDLLLFSACIRSPEDPEVDGCHVRVEAWVVK